MGFRTPHSQLWLTMYRCCFKNHSDYDLRWIRCQQGDFRNCLFICKDKQNENIQEHHKGSSRVYSNHFSSNTPLCVGSPQAITVRCSFTCFPNLALPSAFPPPLKIKNFTRVMFTVTKTDEIDARLIALYGERMQPAPYKLRSVSILILKQKRTVLRQLKKQLVATRNLKGSMEVLPFFNPKC